VAADQRTRARILSTARSEQAAREQ
jgi:hypothetical protein